MQTEELWQPSLMKLITPVLYLLLHQRVCWYTNLLKLVV